MFFAELCKENCLLKPLSIGDRFSTDIEPILRLGGDGVLISVPKALSLVLEDLRNKKLKTQSGTYTFFRKYSDNDDEDNHKKVIYP